MSLSYSSSTTTSFNPEQNSGIPYGEGWQLSMSYISVDNFGFDYLGTDSTALGYDSLFQKQFTPEETRRAGQVYAGNYTLRLPGFAGKLVYKNPHHAHGGRVIYTLADFSSYVEAEFNGQDWKVTKDDGTRYHFTLKQYRQRNPSGHTANLDVLVGDQLAPKYQIERWYLTSITHPNHSELQRIELEYETMGAMDFQPHLQQPRVKASLFHGLTGSVTVDGANYEVMQQVPECQDGGCPQGSVVQVSGQNRLVSFPAYRDVLLKRVYSTDRGGIIFEEVELKHRTWDPAVVLQNDPLAAVKLNRGNFVRLGDPDVSRLDSLYSAETIWFSGQDDSLSQAHPLGARTGIASQNFQGWRRYTHPRAHQNPLMGWASELSTVTPFAAKFPRLFTNGNPSILPTLEYLASRDIQPSDSINFEHSILESPRIDLEEMPSGDLYEFRALIRTPEGADMNFDVSLVSGLEEQYRPFGTPSNHKPVVLNNQAYDFVPLSALTAGTNGTDLDAYDKGFTLFTTQNRLVKWNPVYQKDPYGPAVEDQEWLVIGDVFHLNNLPTEFGGFHVQIGPATDNTRHWISRNDLPGYYQYYNNVGDYRWDIVFNQVDFTLQRFFGTGAPVEPFFRQNRFMINNRPRSVANFNIEKGKQEDRRLYWHYQANNPGQPGQTFPEQTLLQNGANQPTAVTIDSLVDSLLGPISTQSGGSITYTPAVFTDIHETRDARLWNVELRRISKNPWMLDSVIFRAHRQDYAQNLNTTAVFKLNYQLEQVRVLNNVNTNTQNPLIGTDPWKQVNGNYQYRNIWQLKNIERLPIDPQTQIAYKNGEVPTTHFEYYPVDYATPYVEETALLKTTWNEIGGKTEYEYFPLGDQLEIHAGKKTLNSDGSVRYSIIGRGSVHREQFRVKFKRTEDRTANGQPGWVETRYEYQDSVELWKHYSLAPNFAYGGETHRVVEPIRGYRKTTVFPPSPDGQPTFNRMEYIHFTDLNTWEDTLIFGRLKKMTEYNGRTSWIAKQETEYQATLAYQNGFHYDLPDLDNPDSLRGKPYAVPVPGGTLLDYEGIHLVQPRLISENPTDHRLQS